MKTTAGEWLKLSADQKFIKIVQARAINAHKFGR